jgi:YVTN family beta-propeller protein
MKKLLLASFALIAACCSAGADTVDRLWLPTGQNVTPSAAPGSVFQPLRADLPGVGSQLVGGGAMSVISPNGKTLFVLSSGYNIWRGGDGKRIAEASTEHLFVYAIADGLALRQDIRIPNTYSGMAIFPDGKTLVVAGGADDSLHTFREDASGNWSESGTAIALGRRWGNGLMPSAELLSPMAAGIALTTDGHVLVANYENDSVSLVDLAARKVVTERDLRPGKADPKQAGIAGGEFPYWIAIAGDKAFVSSLRDREIVVLSLKNGLAVTARIKVSGNPNRMTVNRSGTTLFVTADNSDSVIIIDVATNKVTGTIALRPPAGWGANAHLPGAAPNSLTLSPDEQTLYVTEGGINAVAVVTLGPTPTVSGLIPTAWQPNAVSVGADGRTIYVINGKSPAGPNPRNCMRVTAKTSGCTADNQKRVANQYVWQHTTGGVASIPVPDTDVLNRLTATVAENNGFREIISEADRALMDALRKRIKHVIYIVKENRTYDQILGDLPGTDGDANLVQFGPTMTPNQHALASSFVALDAFFDSGEASGDGWNWSTAARTTDVTEKEMPVLYAGRGLSYDFEGTTRDINVSLAHDERLAANPLNDKDPDLLPGSANQAAPDGPDGEEEQGYLWDAALRAHKTVRNYGFFTDLARYDSQMPPNFRVGLEHDPAAKKLIVAFPANKALAPLTDLYFRGFDNQFADYWRYREWAREFAGFEKSGALPQFETVRFMHDHTGDFATAADGVNTPETQIADNDYAVGLLVERIAHSRFAKDTLVFVIEDDAQDGPDHVDAHRSIALVAGPYVKHGAIIADHYTTVNLIRTMEDILGLAPLNFHDGNARPMANVFDLKQASWTYNARVPDMLRSTQLPLPPQRGAANAVRPRHGAAYWAQRTRGFDFSVEDHLNASAYNRVLWTGTMGDRPYPATRDGHNRRPRAIH